MPKMAIVALTEAIILGPKWGKNYPYEKISENVNYSSIY